MANVRDQIRMTDDEVWQFLAEEPLIQIATLNRDGSPHLMTMRFVAVDRRIVFHTYSRSQKVRNLERDPRIAVLAEDGHDYAELRGVSINGRAELLETSDESVALAIAVRRRYDPTSSDANLEEATRKMLAKRVVIRVTPERTASWDHHKLGGL